MAVALVVGLTGCYVKQELHGPAQALTAEQRASVEDGVRKFVQQVAADVTHDGPAAWRKEFADSPAFFMASEGKLVFPDSQSATQGIESFAHTIKHIELHWGDDLKIDALTPDLAMVGTSWQEFREDTKGRQVKESGYFTGLVEKRNGQWQFRDAHWSVPGPPGSVQ
jgi:hypothetical protein